MIDVGRNSMNTTNLLSVPFSLGSEAPLQHAGTFLAIVVINANVLHITFMVFHQGHRNFGCHRWKNEATVCTAICSGKYADDLRHFDLCPRVYQER